MSMLLSRCLAKNYVTHESKPIFLSVAKLLNFAQPSSCYSHLSFSSLFFCTAALKYCDGTFGWAIMWREREKRRNRFAWDVWDVTVFQKLPGALSCSIAIIIIGDFVPTVYFFHCLNVVGYVRLSNSAYKEESLRRLFALWLCGARNCSPNAWVQTCGNNGQLTWNWSVRGI